MVGSDVFLLKWSLFRELSLVFKGDTNLLAVNVVAPFQETLSFSGKNPQIPQKRTPSLPPNSKLSDLLEKCTKVGAGWVSPKWLGSRNFHHLKHVLKTCRCFEIIGRFDQFRCVFVFCQVFLKDECRIYGIYIFLEVQPPCFIAWFSNHLLFQYLSLSKRKHRLQTWWLTRLTRFPFG